MELVCSLTSLAGRPVLQVSGEIDLATVPYFRDHLVRAIAERKEGIVYMLWGSYAQKKGAIADPQRNLILKAVHPSPLSVYRGFFGCRHFSRANDYLRSIGKEPIVW